MRVMDTIRRPINRKNAFCLILAGALIGCGSQPSTDQSAGSSPVGAAAQKTAAPNAPTAKEATKSAAQTAVSADIGNTGHSPALVTPLAPLPATPTAHSGFVSGHDISLPPKDDCAPLAGWTSFRERLEKAVRSKEAEAFAALTSADVRLDYGGGSGRVELLKRLADPKRALWHELEQILPLGCATDNGLAVMPWYFWNVPDEIDPYTTLIAIAADVPLLTRPDDRAEIKSVLNWKLVSIKGPLDPSDPFTKVTTAADTSGYIRTSQLRSLLDYRLIAENTAGEWRITAFVAGD